MDRPNLSPQAGSIILTIRKLATLFVLFASASACADEPVTAIEDFDDIPGFMQYHKIPGISIAIIKDFEIDKVLVYGVTEAGSEQAILKNTRFQAGSISQSVTAVAALKVFIDKEVDINSNINSVLTKWELDTGAYPSARKITLKKLLSHTAGTNIASYEGYQQGVPVPSLLNVLDSTGSSNSPAVIVIDQSGQFRYSAGGYSVVQQALVDVSKKPFTALMRDTLLEPVGMSKSFFDQPPPKSLTPTLAHGHRANGKPIEGGYHVYPEQAASGLWTTAEDLAKFVIAIQKAAAGERTAGLNEEMTNTLLRPADSNYALGFDLDTRKKGIYFAKGGIADGYQSLIQGHLTEGVGVAIMTNSDNGFQAITDLLTLIGRQEDWPDY